MTHTVARVDALEILDSRGRPTIEVDLFLDDGTQTVASVPSGASTGRHEAVERRDGDPSRYDGAGVRGAVDGIRSEVSPMLAGVELRLEEIDRLLIELDGTPDKSRLGANALLAVSLAAARAEAAVANEPLWRTLGAGRPPLLPLPMVNIISGGLHAGRQLDFQDFLVVPSGFPTLSTALEACAAVYRATAELLTSRGHSTLKADEGGFAPRLASHEEAIVLLEESTVAAGYEPGSDFWYAIDVAASHFFAPESARYELPAERRVCDAGALADVLAELARKHPVISLEDPFAEDDWSAWSNFTAAHGSSVQIIGDDLYATNVERLARGIAAGAANGILVKMNQIGTVSETLSVIRTAQTAGIGVVVSARSGETEDPALADLAVGTAAGQIKIGSLAQSERLAKYNRLLRIERDLGEHAVYAGRAGIAALGADC
jgi:enolase